MTVLTRRGMLGGAAAITAAAAGLTNIPAARAAVPMAGKQGPSFYRYKVGDFEVTALNEGVVRNATPANMAVNRTLPDVQKALSDAFLPTDHTMSQFNVVVVNTGKNLVLRATGCGDNGAPTVGNLIGNMNAAGIDPKSIDTILVSHFHGDHINGIRAKAGAANFPNAEIMVPTAEWKHWTDAGEESKAPQVWKGNFGAVKRVFDPIAKDVKQYEYGKELVPGITSVDARGHSQVTGRFWYPRATESCWSRPTRSITRSWCAIRIGRCGPIWIPPWRLQHASACSTWRRLTRCKSPPITCRFRRPASSPSAATGTNSIRPIGSRCSEVAVYALRKAAFGRPFAFPGSSRSALAGDIGTGSTERGASDARSPWRGRKSCRSQPPRFCAGFSPSCSQ
jgi:glyoxylase-like metal-dependent hydrolase (beta-lactamase superfamily II)